ncbi:MAG: MCE family protein [Verrucomicrobia bacterium]|nr:MCE family protein [Verrucomicrobiota bacterium]
MKNSLETRLGVFFALAVLAAILIVELLGGTEFLKRGDRIHALFANVQDLKQGDPVKMAGYTIGRVENIQLADNKVKVTLRINRGETIHTDSKATVKFIGLMGQNFVSITFGSPTAPKLTSDQTIETFEQPDLSSLMAKLDSVAGGIENVTKTFSGDGFQNLLSPLADFVKENSPRLTVTFSNLQNVSTKIASGEGTIGKLIYDEGLYANAMTTVSNMNRELTATTTDLRDLLADAKGVLGQVKSGQGTLGKLLNDDKLYTCANTWPTISVPAGKSSPSLRSAASPPRPARPPPRGRWCCWTSRSPRPARNPRPPRSRSRRDACGEAPISKHQAPSAAARRARTLSSWSLRFPWSLVLGA